MPHLILPYPHRGQQIVRQQAKRFNFLAAGRRWRKTTLCMAIAMEASINKSKLLWGAPTYDQVRIGWEECKRSSNGTAEFNQSIMTMTTSNGGKIIFRSLEDPEHARGHTIDGMVIDESGDVKDEAWYAVLQPMLMDTFGWVWAIGTPKRRNWFWKEHVLAPTREDSISWNVPTLGCAIEDGRLIRKPHELENPDIQFKEVKRLFTTMPERYFRQEIMAEFMQDTGGVFREVEAACVPIKAEYNRAHLYVGGLDWAQKDDYTVLYVLDTWTNEIVDSVRFNQISWSTQRQKIKNVSDKWRLGTILAETNSIGGPNIEALQEDGFPVQGFDTTVASKGPLIETLALAIEKKEIKLPITDLILKAELESYEKMIAPGSLRPKYSAPPGGHDDCVIALALAWWCKVHSIGLGSIRRL